MREKYGAETKEDEREEKTKTEKGKEMAKFEKKRGNNHGEKKVQKRKTVG